MRVTRITQRPNDNKDLVKREKRPRRKPRKLLMENDGPHVTDFTEALNNTPKFTYADFERNHGYINLIKHQVDQAISNYGLDLTYFRKYNTFFKEGDENHANLIYGEDPTAEFYASVAIRAFVSIDNMAWNFNQIGLEGVEQITLYLSIENFEQAFAEKVGEVVTSHFEVPVSGNTINNEVTGMIDTREFQASVYGTFDEKKMTVKNAEVKMRKRDVDISFYKQRQYDSSCYAISGSLNGKLKYDKEKPFVVWGILEGDLSYHSLENIEGSSTWKIAPQVGDYFVLDTPTKIHEEWEITQVFDRNLTKGGLNPLLGKYVFQVTATRRVESYEKKSEELNYKEPGEDINELFGDITKPLDEFGPAFTKKKGKNKMNEITNKLGKNAYDYIDKADTVFGGVQNMPKSK